MVVEELTGGGLVRLITTATATSVLPMPTVAPTMALPVAPPMAFVFALIYNYISQVSNIDTCGFLF